MKSNWDYVVILIDVDFDVNYIDFVLMFIGNCEGF